MKSSKYSPRPWRGSTSGPTTRHSQKCYTLRTKILATQIGKSYIFWSLAYVGKNLGGGSRLWPASYGFRGVESPGRRRIFENLQNIPKENCKMHYLAFCPENLIWAAKSRAFGRKTKLFWRNFAKIWRKFNRKFVLLCFPWWEFISF